VYAVVPDADVGAAEGVAVAVTVTRLPAEPAEPAELPPEPPHAEPARAKATKGTTNLFTVKLSRRKLNRA
jgi:hypothetical protein